MLASIETLLSTIVDYAGLFPPAKLNLQEAMTNYAQERLSSYNWMLGRFVLPQSRLDEFETLLPQFTLQTWSLSLILSQNWQLELERLRSHTNPKIAIEALEFPSLSPTEIEKVIPHLPAGIDAFFEIPFSEDLNVYLQVLKNTPASAKIRTGGMTVDAFPNATQLSQLIFSCAESKVPFKATAGLHHSLPAKHPITYESDSLSTEMHGFLNVVVLAALAYWQKIDLENAVKILQDPFIDNFKIKQNQISWLNHDLSLSELKESRQKFFRSFGSCSFQEPIDDLKSLKLINS